jgi:GntR family transcriptional regulator, transcriptional repressor for pyruvate dehydrogenase complex
MESFARTRAMDNNPALKPLPRTRLHEGIVAQLTNNILSGQFRAGEKLPPERDLAESLDVNRGTVREALKKLEMLGLVEIRHGDGVYVLNYLETGTLELLPALIRSGGTVNSGILKGLLDLRRIILPEVAYHAALNRTDEDLFDLEHMIFHDDDIDINDRDMAIYRLIARSSKNISFLIVLNFFNNSGLVSEFLTLYFSDAANITRTTRFYHDIFNAISEREPERARLIMHDLLVYAERKTIEALAAAGIGE